MEAHPARASRAAELVGASEAEELRELGRLLRDAGEALCPDEDSSAAAWSRPALALNSRVQIAGLKEHTELNGARGRVLRVPCRLHARYEVELEPSKGGAIVAVRHGNLSRACEPARKGYVLLHSVRSRPELNGQSARVVDSPHPDRTTVEIADGQCISVPLGCALPIDASGTGSAAPARRAPGRCCICLETNTECAVADPCGHASVCAACSPSFAPRAPCPMCRCPVEKYIRVFS